MWVMQGHWVRECLDHLVYSAPSYQTTLTPMSLHFPGGWESSPGCANCTKTKRPKPTNISLLQGRRVVDAISSHSHNLSLSLATLNDDQFLLGGSTCEHNLRVVAKNLVNLGRGHVTKVTTMDNSSLGLSEEQNKMRIKICIATSVQINSSTSCFFWGKKCFDMFTPAITQKQTWS